MNRLVNWNFTRAARLSGLIVILGCLVAGAAEPYSPKIAEKSNEGELAIHRFRVPMGMKVDLWAAEPALANPVAFAFDELGRVFVAETFRQQKGVEDNRNHMNWLLDDLAAQTVEDRLAYFKKHLGDEVKKYALEHDRIRLLEDTDGDGKADKSTVFADGFNAIEDGTGAGVLSINGKVFYTCIPKLWQLTDKDGDGRADERAALYDGFGVRVAFRGHDMHGLIVGPDGRLYFSIGDRGFSVPTEQGRLHMPDQGAVFRCELDGSKLEVFCTGLRNPQELAFDDFGNLFTCDNNSDGGDRARWTYITQHSDSGWRMYYQYLPDRGPWNREKLWYPAHPGQAAYLVPPIANVADGPSGLAYYPGTGLDEKYRGHFFLADFRGSAANSGIRTFSVIPKGASFELVNNQEFLWSILATDVDFGFDGGLYVSDWVDGWDGIGKGRLYRFRDEKHGTTPVIAEVGRLMKEGFSHRNQKELGFLLAHPDYRIRLRAQLALVEKDAVDVLLQAATKGEGLFDRLHGIWGLGQLGRTKPAVLKELLPFFQDANPEVRAQVAKICGEASYVEASSGLIGLLQDDSPRVRAHAALALGSVKDKSAVGPLFEVLAQNADADPMLRHAAVIGLVGTADLKTLLEATKRPSSAERLGAVLALRRLSDPNVAGFLNDAEPLVMLEAARAIHDVPIPDAMPALAKLADKPGLSDPLLRRVMNAHFRLGQLDNAKAVASMAANPLLDDVLRVEAITELLDWNTPPPLDRVLGDYRPRKGRSIDVATAVQPVMIPLFGGSGVLRESAAKLAARYEIKVAEPLLLDITKDATRPSSERVASLRALAALKSSQLNTVVDQSLKDADPGMRSEARRLIIGIDPARAVTLLAETMTSDSIPEQQSAISTLASLKRDDADAVLDRWLARLAKRETPEGVQLDLLDAAKVRGTKTMLEQVAAFDATRKPDDHLRDYREALVGGSEVRGKEIFFGRSEVSCRRCHKIDGNGGDVGPDLSRVGLDKTRDYLLEALVDPNKQIAKGFETAILQMDDGKVHAGIIKSDDGQRIQLQKPEGAIVVLEKSAIEDRAVGKSGMPEDLVKKITKSDIRDLVEYLSTLRNTTNPAEHGKK
ncbi:MAG: PVC-type heme-binding CxxCH protein [Planctomycetota bacterium]